MVFKNSYFLLSNGTEAEPPLAQICGRAISMKINWIKTPKWKSKSRNVFYGHRLKLIVLEIRSCRKILLRKVGLTAK